MAEMLKAKRSQEAKQGKVSTSLNAAAARPERKRMVLAFSEDTVSELERVADKYAISKLEVVRRALALYLLVDEELGIDPKHRKLAISEGDKIIERIAITS
jgi:hypothetical protein